MQSQENVNAKFFSILWRGGSHFVTYHKSANASKCDTAHWHTNIEASCNLAPSPTNNNWWFCVNPLTQIPPTNSKGKKANPRFIGAQNKYISHANCFFADFDSKDFYNDKEAVSKHIETLPLSPSAIVDSGNGYHCYWFLDEACYDLDLYSRILKGWVKLIESDPQCASISRKLRIPNTINHKRGNKKPVEFVKFEPTTIYTLADFEPYAIPEYKPVEFDFNRSDDDIEYIISLIDSHRAHHYDEWFSVLCAIKAEMGEGGRLLAQSFSQQSSKFEAENFERQWDAIKQEGDRTGGTLYYFAKLDSPHEYEEWRISKAPIHTDDLSIFNAYPNHKSFTLAQCAEFDLTGQIAEFEPTPIEDKTVVEIDEDEDSEPIFDIEDTEINRQQINDVSLNLYTLPGAQDVTKKGIDRNAINSQDIAWLMSKYFDGAVSIALINGNKRATPYFYNKNYGWTNAPNVFRSLARFGYQSAREVSDLAYGANYRPPSLGSYLIGIKESLTDYLPSIAPMVEQSPRQIIRDKKSYIDLSTGQRVKADRKNLTVRFLNEWPDIDFQSQSIAKVSKLITDIFLPKELRGQRDKNNNWSPVVAEYWEALYSAIGQTYCNETNPRVFHWLYGRQDSGKGVFARLNKMAFPELVENVTPSIIGKRNGDKLLEIGKLEGALAAFVPEMQDINLNENINSLAGDGTAQGRQLYVGLVDVPIRFTIWMMSNYAPNLANESVASRAWIWYTDNEFPEKFDGSDDALRQLVPEYIKFVQICVARYLKHGLKKKPQYMVDAITDIRNEESCYQNFINSKLVIDPKLALPMAFAWAKFQASIFDEDTIKKSIFKKVMLSQKGVYQKRTSISNEVLTKSGVEGLDNDNVTNGRFYMGVGLKL